MPTVSAKQDRFFRACKSRKSRKRMKKKCPSAKVIKEFLGKS